MFKPSIFRHQEEYRNKIKLLSELAFPFRDFNYNYLDACLLLRREIKNMCSPETMVPLIMLGKAAGLKFNRDESLKNICSKIQDNLINTCLSFEGFERDQLTMSWATGAILPENPISICKNVIDKYFKSKYFEVSQFIIERLYDQGPFRFFLSYDKRVTNLISKIITSDDLKSPEYKRHVDDFINIIKDKIKIDDIKKRTERLNIADKDLNIQEYEFIIYLHEGFVNKRFPANMKYVDLCSNDYVKNFKSSVYR